MYRIDVAQYQEIQSEGKRLGRHVFHDSRSKMYAAPEVSPKSLVSVSHTRYVPIFDQGNLGSCTGNAALGCLGTGNLYTTSGLPIVDFDENEAVKIYSQATRVDSFPGSYPPDDTGSDGLSVAKVLKTLGWISGYQHALSANAAYTALQTVPVIVGVNWYTGMDNPDSNNEIHASGTIRGGHEFVIHEIDMEHQRVGMTNSWGTGWGDGGKAYIPFKDFERLLSQQGDVTIFTPKNQPAPTPTPVPPTPPLDAAELALLIAGNAWEKTIWSRFTKAGHLRTAFDNWKKNKGYQ